MQFESKEKKKNQVWVSEGSATKQATQIKCMLTPDEMPEFGTADIFVQS